MRPSLLDQFPHLRALVVGDAMVDRYLIGTARRLCPEGPVPVVAVDEVSTAAGGAANTAVNVAQLGATVSLLSVVGLDADSEALQQQLIQYGVETSLMLLDPDRTTLTKQRVIANGQLVVRFDQGSTAPLSGRSEDKLIALIQQQVGQTVDAVIVSDYGYGICALKLIEAIAQRSRVVVVDSKRLAHYQGLRPAAVKPNYAEAIALLNLPAETNRVAQMRSQQDALLAATGAKLVVVTLDCDGAIAIEAGQPPHHIPARSAPDGYAIGAGDTFVSVLALALAAGATGAEAAAIASAATAVVVQSPGTTACRLADLQHAFSVPQP